MHFFKNNYKLTFLLLSSILFLGAFLKFSFLTTVPPGLTLDEVSIGYNAITLATTGKDQDGNILPLGHFRSLADYKLPLHIYITAASVKFFGNSVFAIRFPGALFATLSIGITFLIGAMTIGRNAGLIASFLLAISPWQSFHSHIGLETNTALFFFLATILCLLIGRKHKRTLIAATLFFILTLYTHHLYWVFLPPFVALFLIVYKKEIFPLSPTLCTIIIAMFMVSSLPLIMEKNEGNNARYNQSFLSSNKMQILQKEATKYCESQKILFCKGRYITDTLLSHVANQYANAFSLITWYMPSGFDNVDVLPHRGLFYFLELPFFLLGLGILLKKRTARSFILLGWLALYPLPLIATNNISAARMTQLVPLPQLVEAIGIIHLLAWSPRVVIILGTLSAMLVLRLVSDMWYVYPQKYSGIAHFGEMAITKYIQSHPQKNFFVEKQLYHPLYAYFFFRIPSSENPFIDTPGEGKIFLSYKNIVIVERGFTPPAEAKNEFISVPEDIPPSYEEVDAIRLLNGDTYARVSTIKMASE